MISVRRFTLERHATLSNTLVTVVENKKDEPVFLTLATVFDSHQYCFLSGVQAVDAVAGATVQQDLRLKYSNKIPKPNGNNPMTVVEMAIELAPRQILKISHPYVVNLRKLSEYEQEFERGSQLLGSLLLARQADGEPEVHRLAPIQMDEKMIDSTFAFTTLTVNNLIFFLIPVAVMAYGINAK